MIRSVQSAFSGLFLLLLLPWLLSCSSGSAGGSAAVTPVPAVASIWAVAWGNSPENALSSTTNLGGQEQSFRFYFYPTISGSQERVHLSNFFGTTPLVVGAARLALAGTADPAIDPTHDAPLTFNGSTSVTIPAGGAVISDTVSVPYTLGQRLAVTMYLPGTFPPLTQHNSQVSANYSTVSGGGNSTTDSAGTSFTQANQEWYLLSGVDVYGPYQGTVVLFGSSSIDGHNSNFGNTFSYPTPNVPVPGQDNDRPSDWLARQLNAAGYSIGVLNAGVLADAAGENSTNTPATGITPGVDRMNRDVLQQPNVKAVVIYLGSIDIRSVDCNPATEIEAALTNMVAQAQAVGVRVILGTLPPTAFCTNPASPYYGVGPTSSFGGDLYPGPENPGGAQRMLVNTWIRTTGAQLPGVVAVADFDMALADPSHPDYLIPNLNSGDDYHPNGPGYAIQSAAIPLSSILGK